jgi:hypothetical protein
LVGPRRLAKDHLAADAALICTTGGGGITRVQTGLLVDFARMRVLF